MESSGQPQSENHSRTVVDTPSSTRQIITGISDLGSAFNNDILSSTVDDNILEPEIKSVNHASTPSSLQEEATTTNLSKRKRSVRRKSTISITEEVSGGSESTIEWKPNLDGWDVSIGLPSGE